MVEIIWKLKPGSSSACLLRSSAGFAFSSTTCTSPRPPLASCRCPPTAAPWTASTSTARSSTSCTRTGPATWSMCSRPRPARGASRCCSRSPLPATTATPSASSTTTTRSRCSKGSFRTTAVRLHRCRRRGRRLDRPRGLAEGQPELRALGQGGRSRAQGREGDRAPGRPERLPAHAPERVDRAGGALDRPRGLGRLFRSGRTRAAARPTLLRRPRPLDHHRRYRAGLGRRCH